MIRTIEQALAATPAIQSIIVIMMLRIKSAIHTSSGQFIYALKLPCTFTASCFCVWRSFSFSSRFRSISCKAAFLSAVRSALGAFRNAPAQRRNVRFWGFWRVCARLGGESGTNRRHGRDSAGVVLFLCTQPVFSIRPAYFCLAASSSSFCICRS